MQTKSLFAAIDLGSNSFRLEIGQMDAGLLRRVEYIKETVRQGNGLDADRNLTPEAMERGWDCLARFGERIAGFKPSQVRAVATQTLREARNRVLENLWAARQPGLPLANALAAERAGGKPTATAAANNVPGESFEALAPQAVSITLAHQEFGAVRLQFRSEDTGLSVAMTSADPDFARAAALARSASN